MKYPLHNIIAVETESTNNYNETTLTYSLSFFIYNKMVSVQQSSNVALKWNPNNSEVVITVDLFMQFSKTFL